MSESKQAGARKMSDEQGFGAGRGDIEGQGSISLERMSHRVAEQGNAKGGYQGIRHLMPGNLSPLRALIEKDSGKSQLDSLKEVNRLTPLQPPFVHRPDSRYLSSLMVTDQKQK